MLYRFADFELDEERYELRRQGAPIELQPKVMEVLLHLIRNAERVCPKDELIDVVWADVSVSEASLVRCIVLARRALDESEGDARIIETVRGRGYRVGVPVEVAAVDGRPAPSDPLGARAPGLPRASDPVARRPTRRRRRWLSTGIAGLLVLGLLWLARPFARLPEARPSGFGAENPVTSVAVIPAPAPGASADLAETTERIAQETTDRLGAMAELRVVAHASSQELARQGVRDPRELGRRLGAGTLVFQRVQSNGAALRVTAEVVDASSGFQRWSGSYEHGRGEDSERERLLTEDLARVVGTLVETGPRFVRKTGKASALDYYLLGREAVHAATRERLLEAVTRYEKAIELDPAYLDAYVALADAYERLWDVEGPDGGWLDRGELAILKALEIEPDHAGALEMYATLLRARKRWRESEAAYQRALTIQPSARGYALYAGLLCMLGRSQEAEPLMDRALELAPLDPEVQRTAGRVHHYLGNHERAVGHLLRAHELDPRAVYTPRLLAGALDASGRVDEAREAFLLLTPRFIRPLARIHGRLFSREAGLRLLLELDIARTGSPCRGDGHGTAMAWALLGERERMLDCLEEDVDRHLYYVMEDPVFDPFRDDPRFVSILARAGYPVSAR